MERGERLFFRAANNVADLLDRDALVRRVQKVRREAVAQRDAIQRWNRSNPDVEPLSHAFEDELIAWCDGKAALPAPPTPESEGATSIADAFEVAQKMVADGCTFALSHDGREWSAAFGHIRWGTSDATAATPAHAISLAALAAFEARTSTPEQP